MKSIDKELIEWAVTKIRKEYPEDVALLIGQQNACKIPTDEPAMAFDYYVPATERGFRLAETFIIGDMGYDLYPMTFERLEGIADFKEPRMIWVLEKSEILYAGNEADRIRFEQIKETLHRNLSDSKRTISQALEYLDTAMEVYKTLCFEERIGKARKAAGGISRMLVYALAMVNGTAVFDGYGDLVREVENMKVKPEGFTKIYRELLKADDSGKIAEKCRQLIRGVRDLLSEIVAQQEENIGQKEAVDYEDLAFWYQEARYTFRRLAYYAGVGDAAVCYSLGCYLQIEFDAVSEEFQLKEMDLMGTYSDTELPRFAQKAEELEQYIVSVLEENHVKLNAYRSLEDFLSNH